MYQQKESFFDLTQSVFKAIGNLPRERILIGPTRVTPLFPVVSLKTIGDLVNLSHNELDLITSTNLEVGQVVFQFSLAAPTIEIDATSVQDHRDQSQPERIVRAVIGVLFVDAKRDERIQDLYTNVYVEMKNRENKPDIYTLNTTAESIRR